MTILKHKINIISNINHTISEILIIENKPLNHETIELISNYSQLRFYGDYKCELNNIPDSIKYLYLGHGYNLPLNNLPNLIKLSLGNKYNQPLDNLPLTLKILILGDRFNQPLDNLPNELEEIYLSTDFNQSLDNLPDSVKIISFTNNLHNSKFNKPINKLPKSLIKLKLVSQNFNMPLMFPENLTYLELSDCSKFNQEIILPNNLHTLSLGENFNKKITWFPETLQIVMIYSEYQHSLKNIKYNNIYLSLYLPLFNLHPDFLPDSCSNITVNTNYKYYKELFNKYHKNKINYVNNNMY
jgi:hypothetical protein